MKDWNLFWAAIAAITVVLGSIATGAAYFVKVTISHELQKFENRFLERLNGRYLKQDLAQVTFRGLDERVANLQRIVERRKLCDEP